MPHTRQEEYTSPFSARYSSKEMSYLFSPHFKISTFRKLWAALAKAEQRLGLPITHQQVAELEDNVEKIDFTLAHAYEKKFRHDVMAHIHAFGDQCPNAKPIIHLGATSAFVTDNADLIQLKTALTQLFHKLLHIIQLLLNLAQKEASTPCLAYTHYQPAQPTTVGKRFCLWLQDFLLDAQAIEHHIQTLPFLGAKGATGTQASFLTLFDQDSAKVKELDKLLTLHFGFEKTLPISGQTYTRKLDLNILNSLESLAASAHKMATDIRLLAHDGEITETSSSTQVGSSAMPYKQNPIYAERICGISRFVMSLAQNPAYTTATQWLERSLDDSSNRRFSIPEAFLGADAILNLLIHLLSHLSIHKERSLSHLKANLSHLCMEEILMLAVKKGADRQTAHETLRKLSHEPIEKIAKEFHLDPNQFEPAKLIGRATEQVEDFLKNDVQPYLAKHKNISITPTAIEI